VEVVVVEGRARKRLYFYTLRRGTVPSPEA